MRSSGARIEGGRQEREQEMVDFELGCTVCSSSLFGAPLKRPDNFLFFCFIPTHSYRRLVAYHRVHCLQPLKYWIENCNAMSLSGLDGGLSITLYLQEIGGIIISRCPAYAAATISSVLGFLAWPCSLSASSAFSAARLPSFDFPLWLPLSGSAGRT